MENSPENHTQPDSDSVLGILEHSFTARRLPGRVMLGTAVFCGLFSIVELITAYNKYHTPPSEILSDRFRQDGILIAVVLGVVFLLLAGLLVRLYLIHLHTRVDVYENGLIVHTLRASAVFPWEEISELRADPLYGGNRDVINWNITLVRGDGKKAQFRGLDGILTLKTLIERKARYLL